MSLLNHYQELSKKSIQEFLSTKQINVINFQQYQYALSPGGKYLRPSIVFALSEDLKLSERDAKALAISIEFHHTYTLIHDDLPCMDDDDFRRGKESLHRKFNEFSAVLVGDGLLNLSYGVLASISHQNLHKLIYLYNKLLGPEGLILGQYLDLSHKNDETLKEILHVHKLKTSRLFQASLLAPYYLAKKTNWSHFFSLYKIGHYLGPVFQLMDDRDDFNSKTTKSKNELNCFKTNYNESLKLLSRYTETLNKLLIKSPFNNLQSILTDFFKT